MLNMFKQLFNMIATFFAAGDKLANAALNVATVTEEMSAGYLEIQRIEQAQKVTALRAKLKEKEVTKAVK